MPQIGDKFHLFGTDTTVDITADTGTHWEVTIAGAAGHISGVLFAKQSLAESVTAGYLIRD